MYLAILLPSIFALFAFAKRKVTFSAAILAWLFGVIITYFGDIYCFIALALTFILTVLSDKIKTTPKDKDRNIYQIISNVLTPTLAIIMYKVTNDAIFYTMYYCVLASSLGDTLASSIGTRSNQKPINILTLKPMEAGESGAISWLGTVASMSGGLVLGLVYYSVISSPENYLLIIFMGTLGSFIDSILGLTLQGQYKCMVCNKYVEQPTHCDKKTKLIKGYACVDNNLVNLLNNIFIFIISYLILF